MDFVTAECRVLSMSVVTIVTCGPQIVYMPTSLSLSTVLVTEKGNQ